MPLYGMKCKNCGHAWEVLVSKPDVEYTEKCRICGDDVRRDDFYATGDPVFIGDGFYKPNRPKKQEENG